MAKSRPAPVIIRNTSVGEASAEFDGEFLRECFIDAGFIEELLNCKSNRSIIIGRVGAGKSGLISEIAARQNKVVSIDPSHFSLSYIANSDVIRFLDDLGIHLDPIYQALWKHVLCVELIKLKYNIRNEADASKFSTRIQGWIGADKSRSSAMEYFREWGGSDFWKTTDTRVKEIVSTIENKIQASLKAKFPNIAAMFGASATFTEAERKEITSTCKKVVNDVQLQSLQQVINLLGEHAFAESEQAHYILIDDLDQNWAEDEIRYRLIRALIETIKRLRRLRSVKIIIALRLDLLDTVLAATRDSGFQEEKFEDFFLRVDWTNDELYTLINKRIKHIFKSKYTRDDIQWNDLFAERIKQKDSFSYMIERTLKRPRDIITFVNLCLSASTGKNIIGAKLVQNTEEDYSKSRIISLCSEWHDIYPDLAIHLKLLDGMPARFEVSSLPVAQLNEHIVRYVELENPDHVSRKAIEIINDVGQIETLNQAKHFISEYFYCLQKVGLCGIKRTATEKPVWAENRIPPFLQKRIEVDTKVYLHPLLNKGLGLHERPTGQFGREAVT